MERKLAKIFQFLSGCIIIVEIVGESGLKAAAVRSARRLQHLRERSVSQRMIVDVRQYWRYLGQREVERTITNRVVNVVRTVMAIVAILVIGYLWPSSPGASILEDIGHAMVVVVGGALAGTIIGMLSVGLLLILIRLLVIPIERLYGAVLNMLGRFLEHDRVKKRLLTTSFVFLVTGTVLDMATDD